MDRGKGSIAQRSSSGLEIRVHRHLRSWLVLTFQQRQERHVNWGVRARLEGFGVFCVNYAGSYGDEHYEC